MAVQFGVLGPVEAWDAADDALALKGPRHRAVLARLLAAHGQVVPLPLLIDDLWEDPPADPVGAVRTFVGDLRRALEPKRAPRVPSQLLVTEGAGYALRTEPAAVDAWRFEEAVTSVREQMADAALARLDAALGWWRGPAYSGIEGQWARAERGRLTELRLHAVELQAGARLEVGRSAAAVPDLDAHVTDHPWREEGWRLLALALYRSGRQGEALDVLRRARTLLVEQFGVDPGAALQRLETGILQHEPGLELEGPDAEASRVWAAAAAMYHRTVASGSPARLRSTVELLRSLAITGGSGLEAAREQRLATIRAAEELGDPALTARVIGAYDVPAIWSRSDDADQAAQVVAAAERTLAALGSGAADGTRARLLATIAVESRGAASGTRAHEAAFEAEAIARRADEPALLAFALNGRFMQSFAQAGLADSRAALGAELVELASRRDLPTFELLGHLIRMQALSALGDFVAADAHAQTADRLAEAYESPLVGVFTGWYRALRLASSVAAATDVATAYRDAARRLDGAGMPGLQRALLPLALLALRVQHHRPAPVEAHIDWGPSAPWVRPLVLLARGERAAAVAELRRLPAPPGDHLLEVHWCLVARAAVDVGDDDTMARAVVALAPAASELAGAGSGLLTLGPVSGFLDDLRAALGT